MEYGLGLGTLTLDAPIKGDLILVLMEYGLGRVWTISYWTTTKVLILVLMEYGLGHGPKLDFIHQRAARLNPCFNGIWSRTQFKSVGKLIAYMS